jgi:hypothetical protein
LMRLLYRKSLTNITNTNKTSTTSLKFHHPIIQHAMEH